MRFGSERFCLSIGKMPILEAIKLCAAHPFVEFRLDLLRPTIENLQVFSLQTQNWIATCRKAELSENEQFKYLSAAIYAGATFVDVEIETEKSLRQEIFNLARQNNCKTILSFHDFEQTPNREKLLEIKQHLQSQNPDFIKITTFANSEIDNENILSLYQNSPNLLAFCMGKIGAATRIEALKLGSPFAYIAPDDAPQTAIGQPKLADIQKYINS